MEKIARKNKQSQGFYNKVFRLISRPNVSLTSQVGQTKCFETFYKLNISLYLVNCCVTKLINSLECRKLRFINHVYDVKLDI
jgi:hypothetical protein